MLPYAQNNLPGRMRMIRIRLCITIIIIAFVYVCGSHIEVFAKNTDNRLSPSEIISFHDKIERIIGSRKICVVAVDPRSGQILAIINEEMAYKKSYPPGSAIKPITAYAGLSSGKISSDDAIECRNKYKIGSVPLICSLAGGHGKTDIQKAIAYSCNIYFYNLSKSIGANKLLKAFKEFGLGRPVSDIRGEISGSVPISLPDSLSLAKASVGNNRSLKVTPIQMASVASMIANQGKRYRLSYNKYNNSLLIATIAEDDRYLSLIRKSMRIAVTGGTAKAAAVKGLSVCGKTGSPPTEREPQYRHGWFIGFAPYDKPKIVVAVLIEYGHGGTDAAPVAGKVFKIWNSIIRDKDGRR